ncbi:MAG: S-layer homology domain-containing protein [Candidatus Peregrinibacteria bacterium]|nr:S-layer homology domain-containing protein [Candidatus Peregrinibacteria bacterium]MDZ4244593.1 S-layer homology domain-containing protein [Candidatus Gracilibacteria bacterium]
MRESSLIFDKNQLMRRYIFTLIVVFSALLGFMFSQTTFALMGNPNVNMWDQYAYTEIVDEGELCGDVDQNATRGGTYYRCASGLSCDVFPQDGNRVEEPYGRCVVNERYMCEATGGEVYDDMTCNCPLSSNGGCNGDIIKVTQSSTFDNERNELNIEITAKNTSNQEVSWSEYGSGCSSTTKDIFGVRIRYTDPPFAFSPTPNPREVYIIGGEDSFYEFSENNTSYDEGPNYTCMAYVKNTFKFKSREVKKAQITIPGYLLNTIAYTVEVKYGIDFEFKSGDTNAYRASCTNGQTMINGRCDYVIPKVMEPYEFYDIRGHWGEVYILEMLDLGVVEGYRNHYFYPDRPITRAEFTKMLLLALNYKVTMQPATERQFADVRVGDWYADFIYTAALGRVVEGYVDGTFKPDESIDRAEAIALALRAAQIEPYSYSHTFFYDVTAFWQKPYIETAYRLNLINGKGGGKFDPDGQLTRAEAAKIASNLIRLKDSNVPKRTAQTK